MRRRCRICHIEARLDASGRCRLCREAKAAADASISYGRFKAQIYLKIGDCPDLEPDWYRCCPVCGKVFAPKRRNQIYDSTFCAHKAAAKKYYDRKRAGHRAPADQTEDTHGTNASDQDGGRFDQNEPVAQDQEK